MRTCTVQRRDSEGVDVLTGCVLSRVGGDPCPDRTLETPDEWFAALRDVFDLPLTDVDAPGRDALWARVRGTHESWLGAQTARTCRP